MIKRALFIVFLILVFSAPAFAQTSQSISLMDGFNFVSFTVNPSLTPAQLKASYPLINDIYFYSAAAGSFLSLNAGELTTISAGRGYIIKTTVAGSISVPGTAVSSVNVITLKTGFNLVGFSKMPETVTFVQLMQRASNIKGLYKWNAAAGTFFAVIRNGSMIEQIDGVDPVIKSAESYFFNMLEDTTLDYNGTTIAVGGGSSNRVATPVFSPAGGIYTSSQSVVISCATSGAAIRYTTDGTTPTVSSQLYISPISVSQTMTISAIAIKAGLDNSYASTATYTFGQTQAPAITSVVGTSVDNGNDNVKITFNTSMNKTAVEMSSNWTVKYDDDKVSGGETVLSLTATPFFYDSNNHTLTISLQKVSNMAYLPNGKYVVVTPSSNIKSAGGTAVSVAPIYSTATVSGDSTPPNPLPEADKIKLCFNNAAYKVSVLSSPLTVNREPSILEVYAGSSTPSSTSVPMAKSVIKGVNGFLTGDLITGMATVEVSAAGVWYRFSDGAGNKSAWLQDGYIPVIPNVSAVSLNNQNGEINIGSTAITSSAANNNSILVYYDLNGMGNGLTLYNYTSSGQINSVNAVFPAIAKNGFWTPITDGTQISYAIKNIEDNISARAYDRSNPPAPVKANKIFISAYNKTIHCSKRLNDAADNTDMVLYIKVNRNGSNSVYKSSLKFNANDPEPRLMPFSQFVHVSGDIITSTFPRAGDKIYYALEKAGRISSYTEDGDVPASPDAARLAYFCSSAAGYPDGGYVIVSSNAVSDPQITGIICHQSDDSQGSLNTFVKGALTQINDWSRQYGFLARGSNSNPPVANSSNIEIGKYVLYTHVNVNGNISAYTVDGIIPARPSLPEAAMLLTAGDGGAGAEAGYVNKNGHMAVKLRPAVPLMSGEAVALTAVSASDSSKYITMTARASIDATPVFGEQTPDVIYTTGPPSASGDSLSGALTFANNLATGDIRIAASKINSNGNASLWSDYKIIKYPASAVPPTLVLTNCRATDDDNDGKLNTLILEFNTEMKINGSLNISKSLTGFHNGATVFNGVDSAELVITRYSLSANKRQLIIEFNNGVAGTGLVGINIVNFDQNNFLSDLFGNRLAPINLDGGGGRIIPDKVAPTASKIIAANLSYNNATGKVVLANAAIDCGEKAKLEICFETSPLTTAEASFSTNGKYSAGDLISGIARKDKNINIKYRLNDESKNSSGWVTDGKVAEEPDAVKIAYLAYETVNQVTAEVGAITGTNSTVSKLICYQSDDAIGTVSGLKEKGSIQGVDLTGAFSFTANSNGGVISGGKYVLYSLVNENGNISVFSADGTVPVTPALPAAALLVQNGDGGAGSTASFVNSAGAAAVKMRPAIELALNDALIIKATLNEKTIKVSALATANDVTPVFGNAPATANVTFSNFGDVKNGSADNGSLNFSTLSTGKVPVQAFKYNTVSGNASSWSSPGIEIIYGASDSQPVVKVDDCYATDDDKDGNINYLFIKFDREMQIVGTLDPSAGTNKFHYGITVFNGSIDVPLNITATGGYAMVNDADSKKTLLKIAFDDTVKGTGLVKLNIYNADVSNYISDLFGNKLAAKNLDGTAGNAIPDKVAPSSGANIINKENLYFSKASHKVECKTDIICSEKVKLDIFFGNYPSAATVASNTSALYEPYTISAGTVMTQADETLPGDGSRVWYRLVDSTNTNKSDWVEDGTIPASPSTINLTWSDSASHVTISNSALASSTELLRIYRKNLTIYTYLGRTITSATHNDKLGPYAIGVSYPAEKDLTNEVVKVHVSPGDAVAYSIYNTSGNESSYATDTNSPPDVPLAEKLYVNAENASINYSASLNNSTNDDLKIYVKITRGTTVAIYKAAAFFDGDSSGELAFATAFGLDSGTAIADFPKPGDAVEYALANSNNKISAYVPDGIIPTAPTNANKFTYNAGLNTVNYGTLLNGSANTAFKLFVSAADAANNNIVFFASNNNLAAGPASLILQDCVRVTAKGAEGSVYDAAIPAVKANILVKYGVVNANGNISKLTSSITVPAAPVGTNISYSAATGMVSAAVGAAAAGADATLSCYQADTVLGANLSALKGSVTGVNFAAATAKFEAKTGGVIEAGKYAVYTLTDVDGNVSAFANDGLIPAAPYANKLFYSAAENSNHVNVFSGATTITNAAAVLTCYQSDNATGNITSVKGSIESSDIGGGKNLTNAFQFDANTGGVISVGSYVLYTITNEHGNESAYVADGTVPATPLIPEASSLVAAGDGGSFVSAGYVSTAGKTAVKMRPGVALLSGEIVTLKVVDDAAHVIKMSASALAGITPIFGEQTPNAVYSAGATSDGNITTGSFNFTALTTKAVAASASITNTNGNSSVWSDPVINFAYNVADEAAPAITAASSYATDDDKDGKLNTLVLKFNKPIKINGTLPVAAGAGNFHNVISVNNGATEAMLNVTGYSIGGDNKDLLTIAFDNAVAGTGQVKANIVNASSINFISDFYGVKLAATPLDASVALKTIPDTVAPSASKINVANLFYSQAAGKVALKNAAIDCGELAELQVYFGTDPTPVTNKSFGTVPSAQHVIKADIISGGAVSASGVYYRLVDSVSGTPTNKSDWVSDGGIPEAPNAGTAESPNLVWSDATSQFTVNGISVGASNSILKIYRNAGGVYTYLGRAVVNESNTDKKGAYDAGTHWAKQDGDLPVKVYDSLTHIAAYTLFNDNGNESAYAVDPVTATIDEPLAANLFVNAQQKTINCLTGLNGSANTGLRLCLKVTRGTNTAIYKAKNLFTDNNSKALTFITDFDRSSTTSLDDFPMVGDAISYALESATGKISNYTTDGTIPAGPLVTSKFIYDASANKITYPASINNGSNMSYKLFVEASKGLDKVLFDAKTVFADNNSGNMVLDATKFNKIAIPALNEANVYSFRLKDGVAMKYSLIDANGNISASTSGGTVPAAPDATKLSYSLALNSFTTLPELTANINTGVTLTCYLATDANGTGLTLKGSKTGVNFKDTGVTFSATANIPANNYVLYTLTDEYGNTSNYTSDDIVPNIPTVTNLAYSATNGEVKASGNVADNTDTNCVLKCYQADDAAGASNRIEKGSKTGINFKTDTVTFMASAGGIISADKYLIYTLTNQYGNTSAFVNDGKVPFAPDSSALNDLAIRASSETGKYEVQGDVTPPSNLTASMTVLMTLDNATTTPADCGTTNNLSVYSKVSNLGNVSALTLSMTPKYAYKNSDGNIGALSAADGALQSLSSVSLEPMGGVITFTFSAPVNGMPAQADLDTGKSGVMALAADVTGTAASSTATHVTDNWLIGGDANSPARVFTIKAAAKREQNIAGQILPFGDGTVSGGKLFNLVAKGTTNVFDAAGGNLLIPASADRKISFNVTNDVAPALGGVKGQTGTGPDVFQPLANGLGIINFGKFELEFNKPVLASSGTLFNSTTTSWASSNKPSFNGVEFATNSTAKMTLTNSTNTSTTVTTNDSLNITKTAVKDLTGKSPDTDYKFTVVNDITPPVFSGIAIQSAGYNNNVITLNFSKSVWWGTTLTNSTHFTAKTRKYTAPGDPLAPEVFRTITSVVSRVKGSAALTLNITLDGAALTDGERVTVSINATGAALIKDNTALENPLTAADQFKDFAADTTPPVFDSITVKKVALNGNIVTLTFSEPVWWPALNSGDLTASVANETRSLTLPGAQDQKTPISTMDITLSGAAIANGQTVLVVITLAGSVKFKDGSYSTNQMQGSQNKNVMASVSASPNPSHFFANARTRVVTIKGSTPNATVKVFKDADTTASANTILGSTGEGTASLSALTIGTSMSYSLTEAGKIESPIISDGIIPDDTISGSGGSTLNSCLQASGVTDKVKSNTSMSGTGCYLIITNASNTSYIASNDLVANTWVSPKSSRGGVNNLPLDPGDIYYQFENADGNSSVGTVKDGSIAGTPDSTKVHVDANGKISSSTGTSYTINYTVYYTAGSNPPVTTLNENVSKMLESGQTLAGTAILPAVNSTVVGDSIQWVTYDSASGNYSEGSQKETLVGVGNEASAYKDQVKKTEGTNVDIFTTPLPTGVSMSYLKVLFTGPIVVTSTGSTLNDLTEISGPAIGVTNRLNTIITAVAGKTSNKVSIVLKIANSNTTAPPTFTVTPGTTKFNLTSATARITDAHGNAVFPAIAGAPVSTLGTTETDD